MELTANVWPVVDQTGLVLRYFMRAYAMDAPDDVITKTLKTLAPTDFLMAQVFRIPQQFTVVSAHGSIRSCVLIADFHQQLAEIIAAALTELEASFAKLQGISVDGPDGQLIGVGAMPRFPREPYLVTTTLVETPDGRLIPQG